MYIYTVVPGDTLRGISSRFGVPLSVLANANGLTEPYALTPGQAILVRNSVGTYTVAAGDSAYSVATRFGLTTRELWQLNPQLSGEARLFVGQTLVTSEPSSGYDLIKTGFAYPFIERSVLSSTTPYLDYLAVFSYGFRPDGSLVIPDDEELLRTAASYGTRATLVLTSIGDDGRFSSAAVSAMLTSPSVRAVLIENIADIAESKGYAAVNSDFEYIPSENRDDYSLFISLLANALHARGIELTVSLPPKTSDEQRGLLYEGIDYAALGSYADRVLLMTYEWGYAYSEPRAVAPINLVTRVVDYALTRIPREKIDLGIPNYGYDWQIPWVEGNRAPSLGNIRAQNIAIYRGVPIMFDDVAQTPYFRYTDDNGNGHEVWFEDARSIEAKLNLARDRGLGGIGVWQIMRWFPQLWLLSK